MEMRLEDHYRALERAREINDREEEARALLGLGRKLQEVGELDRARRSLDEALEISQALVDPESTAQILLSLGEVHRDADRAEEARRVFLAAIGAFETIGDDATVGWIHGELGALYKRGSRYREAMRHLREALPRSRAGGELAEVAWTLAEMGEILALRGTLGAARRKYEEALAVARVGGDLREEAWILGALGDLSLNEGRDAEAETCYREGAEAYARVGDADGEAGLRLRLADRLREVGEEHLAHEEYSRALAGIREAGGDPQLESAAHSGLGMLAAGRGDFARAMTHFKKQLAFVTELDDPLAEHTARMQLGLCFRELGRIPEGYAQLQSSLTCARLSQDRAAEARSVGHLADLDRDTGSWARAHRRYEELLRFGRALDDGDLVRWALGGRGEVREAIGELDQSLEDFRTLLAEAGRESARALEEYALAACGRVLLRMGRHEQALQHLTRSLRLSRESGNRAGEGFALASLGLLRASSHAGQLHDLSEAVALGERAVQVTERKDPICLETLARLYVKAGEPKRAWRVVREALRLPDLPSGLRTRLKQQLSTLRLS